MPSDSPLNSSGDLPARDTRQPPQRVDSVEDGVMLIKAATVHFPVLTVASGRINLYKTMEESDSDVEPWCSFVFPNEGMISRVLVRLIR